MTAPISEKYVQLATRKESVPERSADRNLIIGKDILELLSSAMYLDPLTVYREYIQNAADAIDEALNLGLLEEGSGRIVIELDVANRDIRIRDNGIGLGRDDAELALTAFGASRKRGGTSRGFRGVGRLAGLSYAQFLTFRTKATGEGVVTEVRWDCRKLKAILHDSTYGGHLGEVVRDVVTVRSIPEKDLSSHFFEVRIERPIRIKNDLLLNEEAIREYIGQVAPLPFHTDFAFGQAITKLLDPHAPKPCFAIYLNGAAQPLTRPFRANFQVSKEKSDQAVGFEPLELRDSDGTIRAVGWVLDHSYLGAIQGAPALKGLRARVGDIQVGGDDIFAQVFPEQRFNSWTIGELHILDRTIIPNGRRDNFEQNSSYYSLISQLAPIGRILAKRCRVSSARRNQLRRFEIHEQRISEELSMLEQNVLRGAAAKAIRRDVVARLNDMERLLDGSLIIEADREDLAKNLAKLRTRLARFEGGVDSKDPLSAVSPKRREIYQEIIGLIYECSANKIAAKALVDRVTSRLKAG